MSDAAPWDAGAGRPAPLPDSLWASISPPPPETPPAAADATADVVIVGAGYMGLSAAISLASAGSRVVVLEAAEIGWGASGRNGGQVIPGLKVDPDEAVDMLGRERGDAIIDWAGAAPDLVFDLIARHAIDCSPVRNGWFQPAYTAANLRIIEDRCAQWAARGAPVRLLDTGEVAGALGTPRYVGAWIDRRAGSINPLAYSRGLASGAIRAGATVHTHTPVRELRRDRASWLAVTPKATIRAGRVIVATGAYGGDLVPRLRRTIVRMRIGEVATRPLSDNIAATILPGRQVASDSRRLLTSFRITPDRRLMMGGSTATAGPESLAIRDSLHRSARDLFGHFGELDWEFFWSGAFAVTSDKIPHLHEPEPNLFAALGCNGRGIAVSTAIGQLLAEHILGRKAADLPLPFSRITPMTFHALHPPVVRALVGWRGVRDRLEIGFGARRQGNA